MIDLLVFGGQGFPIQQPSEYQSSASEYPHALYEGLVRAKPGSDVKYFLQVLKKCE